jgi:hypothetical protein
MRLPVTRYLSNRAPFYFYRESMAALLMSAFHPFPDLRSSTRCKKSASVDALRSASQWVVAASIAAAGLMTLAVRLPVSSDGTDILAWIVAATLIVSLLFHCWLPRLADSSVPWVRRGWAGSAHVQLQLPVCVSVCGRAMPAFWRSIAP